MTPAIIKSNKDLKSHRGERLVDSSGASGHITLSLGEKYAVAFEGGSRMITEDERIECRNRALAQYGEPIKVRVCPECGACMDRRRSTLSTGDMSPYEFLQSASDDEHQRGIIFDVDDEPCIDCNEKYAADDEEDYLE